MALVLAEHDVYGICLVPESYLTRHADAWTAVAPDTPIVPTDPYPVYLRESELADEITAGTGPVSTALRAAFGTSAGLLADRPAASANNIQKSYLATDVAGGTLYVSTGTSWVQAAAAVLTQVDEPVWLDAARMILKTGTPALGLMPANGQPTWALDPATAEVVTGTACLPGTWDTVNVDVHWMRSGTGVANVVWQAGYAPVALGGGSIGTTTLAANVTAPAAGSNSVQVTRVASGLAASRLMRLQIARIAADAADDLAVDAGVLGLMVWKA